MDEGMEQRVECGNKENNKIYSKKTPGGNPFFQWSVESIDLSSMAMVILEILLKN